MSGKIRNPARRCKACGAKCSGQMRYCHTCAIERRVKAKALKVFGIPPEKISVTVVGGTARPPCTTHKALGLDGDYLGGLLPKVRRIVK